MNKFVLAPTIVLLRLMGEATPALADAFLERPASGKVIVTGGFESSSQYLDATGAPRPVAAYRKFTLRARTEYGVTERLTLIGGLDSASVRAPVQAMEGAGALGFRRLMYRNGSFLVSTSALLTVGTGLDVVASGARGATADVRWEMGKTFKALGADAFVTLSAGSLMATGGGGDRRLDATLGFRPRQDVLVMVQTFSRFTQRPVVVPASRRQAATLVSEHASSHKAQASVVWDVLAHWSVQAGAFATLVARKEQMQRGVFAALWRRF